MGVGSMQAVSRKPDNPFQSAFRSRVFAVLYVAETQSTLGDQLARIALSVLVFERTGFVVATALTYAATLLPAVLGGFVLGRLGDRLPRRLVMIGCDGTRAALFALMAVPAMPLLAVVALLVAAVFIGPAFAACEVSVLAATLDDDSFRAATGVRMITGQVAQVIGFAGGGVLVAWLHPRGALLLDAATYLASALLIAGLLGNQRSTAAATPPEAQASAAEKDGFPGLWRDQRLRALIALSALAGFFVVPEGLAVPFGADVGASTIEVGILLAAVPLGGAVGAIVLVRGVAPVWRSRVAAAMAVACGLPLLGAAPEPGWPLAALVWFASGAFAAYQVEVVTLIVRAIPDAHRARGMGIVSAWLVGSQGAGLALFGALAGPVGVGPTISLAGVLGSAAAATLVAGPLRNSLKSQVGRHRWAPVRPSVGGD